MIATIIQVIVASGVMAITIGAIVSAAITG